MASASWLPPAASPSVISGYSLESSVVPGDSLQLAVSGASGVSYRVQVYRLGWYGGVGAKPVACAPSCDGSEPAVSQAQASPDWARQGVVEERWRVTDTLSTDATWASGYYLAELVVTSGIEQGHAALVPFVVRAPAGTRSRILVVAPAATWEAYNNYGGASFYMGPGRRKANLVSFGRPFADVLLPLWYEYPLVRFLERFGYDVSYTTDLAVDQDPSQLSRHRLVIVAGHAEYWTAGMRDAFEQARDRGVNLAFMGGNDLYQQVGYNPNAGTVSRVGIWRLLPQRWQECSLAGVQWQGGWLGDGVETATAAKGSWIPSQPYAVNTTALDDRWFRGTGFTASSTLPGIVGYEWDGVEPGCDPAPTVLFHYTGTRWLHPLDYQVGWASTNADATRYTWWSGATVFSAGSIEFSWGLDDWERTINPGDQAAADPHLQRFVRNMLAQLTAPPPRLPD